MALRSICNGRLISGDMDGNYTNMEVLSPPRPTTETAEQSITSRCGAYVEAVAGQDLRGAPRPRFLFRRFANIAAIPAVLKFADP